MAAPSRIINTIPSHDVVLRRVVDQVTAKAPPSSAADLAERLRPLFPRIAVFERQLSGERPHLYVYRDGRYEPERQDPWWLEPNVPCVHIDRATGTLTAVTSAWAELLDVEPPQLVGRHYLDFVLPEARTAATTMFEVVAGEREVRSEATLLRPDGTTLAIEFRALRTEGDIEVCYRPLDQRPPVPVMNGTPVRPAP